MGMASPREAGPKAKAAALRAIALDDSSAGAHEALAVVRSWTDWDWAGAEPEWRRALELDPNRANAHAYYAHFLANMGHAGEAVRHSEWALKLDPFNALFHGMYSVVLEYQRRYDDAMAEARAALAIEPDQIIARGTINHVFMLKGMRDERLAWERGRLANDPEQLAAFEQGLAEAGYEGAQRRMGDLLAVRYEKAGGVPNAGKVRVHMPYAIAFQYNDAGDYGLAIDWFEKAYEVHDLNLPYIGLPVFDPLRSDPRFQNLLRRIGLPQ